MGEDFLRKLDLQEDDNTSLTRDKIRSLVEMYPLDIIAILIEILDELDCNSEELSEASVQIKRVGDILNKTENLLQADYPLQRGDANVIFDALRNIVLIPHGYIEMFCDETLDPTKASIAKLSIFVMRQLSVLINKIGLEDYHKIEVLKRRAELLGEI